MPSGDPTPSIPLDGNGSDVVRLEDPEILIGATGPVQTGEYGSDLITDATGYYGLGYNRYRPSFYNYYGNPFYNNYNNRYNGNYPQYSQYSQYYPRSSYYYSSKFCFMMNQYRFGALIIIICVFF